MFTDPIVWNTPPSFPTRPPTPPSSPGPTDDVLASDAPNGGDGGIPPDAFDCMMDYSDMRYPGTQRAIVVIYLLGAILNVAAFAVVVGYSATVLVKSRNRKGWRKRFMLFQTQVCICLLLYELVASLGFLLFPCQPLDVATGGHADPFLFMCTCFAAMMLFCLMSAYSWVVVVSLHIIRLVAKQCKDEMNREEGVGGAAAGGRGGGAAPAGGGFSAAERRMTLDDKAAEDERFAAVIQKQRLNKKFSQDLLELYRQDNGRPMYEKELEAAEREERRRARSLWYVQLFSTMRLPLWFAFGFGYLFPAVLTALALATRPNTAIPPGFDPADGSDWKEVEGVDIFCWPGLSTNMLWYQLAYIPITIIGAIYVRMKSVQMVRLMNAGSFGDTAGGVGVTVQSVAKWQKREHRLHEPSELETNFLMPTFLQMWVLSFNTFLGFLMSVSFWGAVIPFSTVSMLKAFVFLFHLFIVRLDFYREKKWTEWKCLRKKEEDADAI